jgi:hypothetical protein
MSPHPHHEGIHPHGREDLTPATNARDVQVVCPINTPRRVARRTLVLVLVALGVWIPTGAALTASGAQTNPRTGEEGGNRSAQLAHEIAALGAKGYTPVACTVRGTLMRNLHTGRSVTVSQ